jgi:hypothetical protein
MRRSFHEQTKKKTVLFSSFLSRQHFVKKFSSALGDYWFEHTIYTGGHRYFPSFRPCFQPDERIHPEKARSLRRVPNPFGEERFSFGINFFCSDFLTPLVRPNPPKFIFPSTCLYIECVCVLVKSSPSSRVRSFKIFFFP